MIALSDFIILLGGIVVGFTAGRLSKRPKPVKNTMPPCTCGHTRGMHEGGHGSCQWNRWHSFTEHREVCPCQVWDGPERAEDIIRGYEA